MNEVDQLSARSGRISGTRAWMMRCSSSTSGNGMYRCRQRRFQRVGNSRVCCWSERPTAARPSPLRCRSPESTPGSPKDLEQATRTRGPTCPLRRSAARSRALPSALSTAPRLDEFLGEEDVAEFVQPADRLMKPSAPCRHFVECFFSTCVYSSCLPYFHSYSALASSRHFVALQSDQRHAEHGGGGFCEFGLADAGRSFDQHRLFQ